MTSEQPASLGAQTTPLGGMEQWAPGDLVWFDPGVGHWLPGEVLEAHRGANVLTIQAVINAKPQTFALTLGEAPVLRRQDLGTSGVEDMTQLSDLHEAALLWNLKLRYDCQLIYTYTGSILIAVNPYRMVDASYGLEAAQRYKGRLIGTLPPHLFALGASAYAALPAPQCVVISGESGSGKTESTKLVMQYLAAVAPSAPRNPHHHHHHHAQHQHSANHHLVTEQILEATPLLEAFGNARTLRNDNSSRFGKYLQVYFHHSNSKGGTAAAAARSASTGSIIGARITQYLLEKSRIVTQPPLERNYHVFYELIGGLSATERAKYGLVAEAEKYFYLNQGGGGSGGGSGSGSGSGSVGTDWAGLVRGMEVLGVGEGEQRGIVRVLASVLHLGNVYFHRRQLRHGQEGVEVGSDVEIKWAAHLLQISATGLQRALTTRITEARSERVHSPLSIDQALDARDAFAKALYSALFNWLVTRINSILPPTTPTPSHISLLDIFGFESLPDNSFEQLCINYASETLQLHFNKHVFKLEQQEYARERLEWTSMTWLDNSPVIALLGKKPVGVLHLLDDESNFPRASDASFLEKCHYNHALNEAYARPRVGGREFGIRHFAGQVWYSVDGFLDKNRDVLRPEVVELLASSKEQLVSSIAKPLLTQAQTRTLPRGTNGRFVTMKPRTPTVAARFSDSLQQLIESMSKCNPWFIRCIKPNNDKSPMRFDMPVVLEQLRYTGMLDTIKIRQSGYPVRMKFQQFVERYRYLLPGKPPRGAPYRDLCRAILDNHKANQNASSGPDYQLGATRIFLREHLEKHLEIARNDQLRDAALVVQKHIRGYLARKQFVNLKRSSIIIQKNWKGFKERQRYSKLKNGVIKAQALHRGKLERKRFAARKLEYKRRLEAEKIAQEKAKQRAAREQRMAQKMSMQNLEIPQELAFINSKIESFTPTHSDRNMVKVVGGINGTQSSLVLPPDINQFEFAKFSSVYFKGADFGLRKEPITAPFLSKAAARDSDFQDSIALFKLILRWSNETNLTGPKERALADYIVHKGISSRGLRDELLVQLVNQSWKNENADRIWQLMSHCLSCFQPSPSLSKYLLKYITDHASTAYKEILQRKIIRGIQKSPHSRHLPPTLLEWRTTKQHCNMALPLTMADNTMSTVLVDSWTTCQEAASLAIHNLNLHPDGWTVVLDDAGLTTSTSGLDFVLDLIADLELTPGFPLAKATHHAPLRAGTRHSHPIDIEHHHHQVAGATPPAPPPAAAPSPIRPQVPPPEPPLAAVNRRLSKEQEQSRRSSPNQVLTNQSSRSSSRKTSNEYSPQQRESPQRMTSSTPAVRKSSHEALSRSSALNERYFDIEKVRSRSLDNLLSESGPESHQAQSQFTDLGLSQSRLNDRYHSVEQLAPIKPVLLASASNYKQPEIDFEYPDVSSISTSNRGGPRYIKSQYSGKKAPPGSHSSKAQIEKSEFHVRSSAMSDTSEAPSLASHVRRVRVPSQASDVDQFLDELFSPVLDGNMDELSDARSLAASIKGGKNLASDLNDYMEDVLAQVTVNEDVNQLVKQLKGGGTTHQPSNGSNNQYSSMPNPITTSQTSTLMLHSPLTSPDTLYTTTSHGNTSLPPNADPTYHQSNNMQRAFLQSAMAQNIQIQQQLLAQNQALQQLLTQQSTEDGGGGGGGNSPATSPTQQGGKVGVFSKNPARKTSSPSDYKMRKSSNESSISAMSRNGVPPPPPMPPPLDGVDPSETRPFLDPYGRAKTVRIGKWRWPPPKDGTTAENGEDFMHFKLRQSHQRKVTPVANGGGGGAGGGGSNVLEWEEMDFEPIVQQQQQQQQHAGGGGVKNSRRSFDVGANRPSPGSVGKLKLSSEMRQRLEQVTANHNSVRSTSSKQEKPARVINKLEDTRKMMLEQQLGGGGGGGNRWASSDNMDDMTAVSGPPSPVTGKSHQQQQQQQGWNGAGGWKPGPPPPPVGPGSLPPAPLSPAPPPPIRPANNEGANIRESYMAQRQDRDTFGVHQNRLGTKTSFSHNWDMNSSSVITQDDVILPDEDNNWNNPSNRNSNNNMLMDNSNNPWAASDTRDMRRSEMNNSSNRNNNMLMDNANNAWASSEMRRSNNVLEGNNDSSWDATDARWGDIGDGRRSGGREGDGGGGRPTFRSHQYSKSGVKEREKKSSVSTQDTEKCDEWPEFMRPIKTPPPPPTSQPPNLTNHSPVPTSPNHKLSSSSANHNKTPSPVTTATAPRLLPLGSAASVTYSRVPWQLRVRKEVYGPGEALGPPAGLHLVFGQIVMDVYGVTACVRLNQSEKRAGITMLSGFGVTAENYNTTQHRANVKRNIIELARTWPLYFARLFHVTGAAQLSDVHLIAVSHWGVHFVRRDAIISSSSSSSTTVPPVNVSGVPQQQLQVLKSFPHGEIVSCTAPRPTTVSLEAGGRGRLSLYAARAQQLAEMVMRFGAENRKIQSKLAHHPHPANPTTRQLNNTHPDSPLLSYNPDLSTSGPQQQHHQQQQHQQQQLPLENGLSNGGLVRPVALPMALVNGNGREQQHQRQQGAFHDGRMSPETPGSPLPPSGRFSLLQYAMEHFRQSTDLDLLKMDSSIKSKEKRKEWTWKQQTDLVKWQSHPIDGSLLRLEDPDLGPLAVECFECILRYCGDMPLTPEMSEVKCVYTVLMHCHKHISLRDEVYCQLMKQTTSNKAETPESAQRAWRLLSIVAAYFGCSEMLGPFLLEHLTSAASDRRRICHGTAVVCLANLRKTQRCGGRKNVPSVEEVTAVSAGRSARRQIYRLPGGAERVVNTRCSTVVNDVIAELCNLIGVNTEVEQQEFSLYCIVQGDAFTMPLSPDEYILDVTTELHKTSQPFYLIYCRSVWYHPLKHQDASPLYTEVLFNQVAPDYLEGLLLRLGTPNLPPSIVRDMSLVASLLHRAADLNHSPTLKEVKFLLPKPVLGLREPRPPQWLALVQTSWSQAAGLTVARAKHRVLQVLSNWQLFGSSFFAVKRVLSGDIDSWQEHILALNRSGVHFLDMTTHETLHHWPYAEVISTRKVRSEDGALFLDMKCGNLLQQRVTRLQTEQAHEISRLVRQYITLEQSNSNHGRN